MKKNNLAFIDLETTGLDPDRHEIIEIGCLVVKQPSGELIEEVAYKTKPIALHLADPEALRINGYDEAEWLFALDLKPALEALSPKIAGAVMVGQNVTFDWSFLDRGFKKTGLKNPLHYHKLDLISIAYGKLFSDPRMDRFSLQALTDYFGLKNEKAHTALADVRVTFEIYKKLLAL